MIGLLQGTAMEDLPCVEGMRWVFVSEAQLPGGLVSGILDMKGSRPALVTFDKVTVELRSELGRTRDRIRAETRGRTKTILSELHADMHTQFKMFQTRTAVGYTEKKSYSVPGSGEPVMIMKQEVQRANFILASLQNIDRMIEVEMPKEEVVVREEERIRPILREERPIVEEEQRQELAREELKANVVIGLAIGGVALAAIGMMRYLR